MECQEYVVSPRNSTRHGDGPEGQGLQRVDHASIWVGIRGWKEHERIHLLMVSMAKILLGAQNLGGPFSDPLKVTNF